MITSATFVGSMWNDLVKVKVSCIVITYCVVYLLHVLVYNV